MISSQSSVGFKKKKKIIILKIKSKFLFVSSSDLKNERKSP
jgi:flagellar assembly factor FliW